ncbi:hypothetical protein OEB99_10585 [Actinotalea sp. M2MS4P-6]|uniref:electron transfer flavoprotein subunit beta/FixA family protein n=1 Tax=Actinotalea sp. M2MS4P-6 TaxID=2983762 RepID=UPI0021E411BF|nr:hypothetical protein [Actinotalea sp. M2MS4P-6]MCV2394754.1 hypothetical protein [Actinotalea sp. M2MS4P-6]
MAVVVAFKWAPDPQDGRVADDGAIDWSGAATSAVGDDAVAVEVARQTAESLGQEAVGITLGRKNADWALARGADRVIAVDADLAGASDDLRAAVLAALARRVDGADTVIIGDSAVDSGAAVVPSLLAATLGRPGLLGATGVATDGTAITVERRTRDAVVTVKVDGPAVIAVAADAATPRVPGMRDVLMARKRPIETVELAELGVDAPGAELLTSRRTDSGRQAQLFDGADPQQAARQLVAALRSAEAV